MDSLPDGRAIPRALRRGAVVTPGPPVRPAFAAGFHGGMALRTCFCGTQKSSMFAELPLDNRTVNKLAALAATSGPS